jgi:ketosteroid isomerase-like protein
MTHAEHMTDQTDRPEFRGLLEDWAVAIVAKDADRIAALAESDWELVTPEGGPAPLMHA